MYEYNVEFFPVKQSLAEEISDDYYKVCNFCEKQVKFNEHEIKRYPFFDDEFYCCFCYRNNFNNYQRKIFSFTLKYFIFNYYENFYLKNNQKSIWYTELEDMIELHKEIGLKNPAFIYDEDDFTWFLDLDKIGNMPSNISMTKVYETLIEIIVCFNFWQINIDPFVVFSNIKTSLTDAIAQKKFVKCMPVTNQGKYSIAKIKNFCKNDFTIKNIL